MREYELIYVIQPDATEEREAEIHGRIDQTIERAGSRVLVRDDWGKRKLAYEIQDFQKGHYLQLNFLGSGTEIQEIERGLRIDADVLRFLTIQANQEVKDVDARIEEARVQAEEQAKRREERARQEEERERERARVSAEQTARDADAPEADAPQADAPQADAPDAHAPKDGDSAPSEPVARADSGDSASPAEEEA